jgi:hypothetical protein
MPAVAWAIGPGPIDGFHPSSLAVYGSFIVRKYNNAPIARKGMLTMAMYHPAPGPQLTPFMLPLKPEIPFPAAEAVSAAAAAMAAINKRKEIPGKMRVNRSCHRPKFMPNAPRNPNSIAIKVRATAVSIRPPMDW